ncbi:hypothetical protein ACFOYU_18575 [Microvirga sp. GCM10011540]|uniref:hypothetical protein n=1 Tax=Microvirga sp. GCM10011540 TaxID=3317338 RepID=UPI003615294D
MADALYSEAAPSRNGDCDASVASPRSTALPLVTRPAPRPCAGAACADPGPEAAVLATAAQAPVVALGDLVGAIPDHPQPLAVILALVDQGRLGIDLQAPFGSDLRLWRRSA